MAGPDSASPPPVFERMDEYKAVMDDVHQITARYANVRGAFWRFHSLIFTAMAVLFFLAYTQPQANVNYLGVLLGITGSGLAVLQLYYLKHAYEMIEPRVKYLQEIEEEFDTRWNLQSKLRPAESALPTRPIGLYRRLTGRMRTPTSWSHEYLADVFLALFFVLLYATFAIYALTGSLTKF